MVCDFVTEPPRRTRHIQHFARNHVSHCTPPLTHACGIPFEIYIITTQLCWHTHVILRQRARSLITVFTSCTARLFAAVAAAAVALLSCLLSCKRNEQLRMNVHEHVPTGTRRDPPASTHSIWWRFVRAQLLCLHRAHLRRVRVCASSSVSHLAAGRTRKPVRMGWTRARIVHTQCVVPGRKFTRDSIVQ